MKLQLFIAWRYLFAKKSHNVINIISAISAAGIAVGTAALILILSIYNGLDSVVRSSMTSVEPDLLVRAEKGKFMPYTDSLISAVLGLDGVVSAEPVLEDQAFADYDGVQSVATVKGVRDDYFSSCPMSTYVAEGTLSLKKGSLGLAVVGRGLASTLGLSPRFVEGLDLYYPDPESDISLVNPMSALNAIRLFPSGVVSVNQTFDAAYVIAPFEAVSELVGADAGECSYLEVRVEGGIDAIGTRAYRNNVSNVRKSLTEVFGEGYSVLDREEQNVTLYRMLKSEKAMVYLILTFVIVIVAFNIFGSLSMLIMEKSDDIRILRAMGAGDRLVRNIFVLEGWLISLSGLVIGLAVGIALALVQQHYGIVEMPGNFTVKSYPVVLEPLDVLLSAGIISVIGYVVALLPVRRSNVG